MQKRNWKSLFTALIAAAVFCLPFPCFAVDTAEYLPVDELNADYEYSDMISSDLTINALGWASCESYYRAVALKVSEVRVYCELQQYNGGWTTIATYSDSGSFTATATGGRFVPRGHDYRVKSTGVSVVNGYEVETMYGYSNIVGY